MSNIFNAAKNAENPQVVLCTRDKKRIGEIYPVHDFRSSFQMSNPGEVSFTVYKTEGGVENKRYDSIIDLKLIYVPDYDEYYEIEVSDVDGESICKNVTGQTLCESELSQLILYNVEVNSESDIARDDYSPTTIYNAGNPEASLLHRVLKDKAPHYTIGHVDASLAGLQRTFSIDGESIDDFLRNTLSQEIGCLVKYSSVHRSISLYDLNDTCSECGHRGEFEGECPKCGSRSITKGYGEDTNVYVCSSNLSDEIKLDSGKPNIKNCFKVCGGDDVITDMVSAVNPNGTQYIYMFSNEQLNDMPEALKEKILSYNALHDSYKERYRQNMLNLYHAIDQILYFTSGMMPSVETGDTNAEKELSKLTAKELGSIGVAKLSSATKSIVDNAVKSYIKIFMSPGYEADIKESSYNSQKHVWSGRFTVKSVDSDSDAASNSANISLPVTEELLVYIKQKIEKALSKECIFDKDYDYTLYGLKPLLNFRSAYESCLDVLVQAGCSNSSSPAYSLYTKYYGLLKTVESEIKKRQSAIDEWEHRRGQYEKNKADLQKELNFADYLGNDLWKAFCSYRRDDKYANQNYVSDGLSDSELLSLAESLVESAEKELYKACRSQYAITTSLYNLFLMDEFKPLHGKIKLGNWIRVEVDGNVYKLRILKLEMSYSEDEADRISIEFSTACKSSDPSSRIKDVLDKAGSIASSYPSITSQVSKNDKTTAAVNGWYENGLDATNMMIKNSKEQNIVIDSHGILCQEYDDVLDKFSDKKLKIINNTIAITEDDFKTVSTALGSFVYQDPATGEYIETYGIIGKSIVGELLLSKQLGIYNESQTLKFDSNGMTVTNGVNTVKINPNSSRLFTISNKDSEALYFDSNGSGHFKGALNVSNNKCSVNISPDGSHIFSISKGPSPILTIDGEGNACFSGKVNCSELTVGDKAKNTLAQITKNTVTAEYINAMNIKAGSVDCENLTGDTINGKEIRISNNYEDNGSRERIETFIGCREYILNGTDITEKIPSFRQIHEGHNSYGLEIYNTLDIVDCSIYICSQNQKYAASEDGEINDVVNTTTMSYIGHDKINAPVFCENGVALSDKYMGKGEDIPYGTPLRWGDFGGSFIEGGEQRLALGGSNESDFNVILGVSDERWRLYPETHYVELGSQNKPWGQIYSTDPVAVTSDRRLKNSILPISGDLASRLVSSLSPVSYKLNSGSSGRTHYGLVAQDVEKALESSGIDPSDFGGLVKSEKDGGCVYGLRYEEFIAPLIKTVQMQQDMIDRLNSEIKRIKERIL